MIIPGAEPRKAVLGNQQQQDATAGCTEITDRSVNIVARAHRKDETDTSEPQFTKEPMAGSQPCSNCNLSAALQEHLETLSSSICSLESTADHLAHIADASSSKQHIQQQQQCQHQGQPPEQREQPHADMQQHDQRQQQDGPNRDNSSLVHELQQQIAALLAEKQQVEADRQEMAIKQGNYKGTIAQLEGALSFSERKVKDQLAAMEQLQAHVSKLTAELQEARGAAAQTPDRCRTAARALQAQADRATTHARTNEAQVKKLRHIVQLGARELSELLDFAEQERITLLEKEAALQQELGQVKQRAAAAETAAEDAAAAAAELEQQLTATKQELAERESGMQQLQEMLASAEQQLKQAQEQTDVLAAERDAAARNLLRAEAELNDVGEYSTKMFRQVRFISHMLDKNSAVLSKLPDFANLARDLRAFVTANASNWERRETELSATAGPTVSMSQAVSQLDTAISGSRDVKGKA